MRDMLLLAGAGLLAGTMNALAGGGTFVTLPAFIAAGVPSVSANASSTVALFPGSLASAWAYRDRLGPVGEGVSLRVMLLISVVGGAAGALLLLATPSATFDRVVPWLLLVGTVAFAFGRQAGAALRRFVRIGPAALVVAQVLLSVYGGYFGGGVGIMMMAVWSLLGFIDFHAVNAAKVLLVGVTNAAAVLFLVFAGLVAWPQTIVLMAAALAGGYGGARLARLLDPARARLGISILNFLITAAFFWRAFAR
jgi:uncharacterized membrane protein YfcA